MKTFYYWEKVNSAVLVTAPDASSSIRHKRSSKRPSTFSQKLLAEWVDGVTNFRITRQQFRQFKKTGKYPTNRLNNNA